MEMVVENQKSQLRQKLLSKLLSLTQEEIKRRSRNVEHNLSSLPIYKKAKTIMVYYPLKGEVDILEMIRKDLKDKRFCFPATDLKAKNLRVFRIANLDQDFIPGPLGAREPDPRKAKEVELKEIEMVVVPGLAFDLERNRLGRGAGFYDRFLEKIAPPALKVAVAFECQILDTLPIHLALDQKVDLIVSENRII